MTITHSTDTMPRVVDGLSFSQVQTLSQCGMKYLIEKGYNERGEPNWASVGGTAVHSMTEAWDRAGAPPDVDLYGQWAIEFEAAIQNEEERSGQDRTTFRHTGRKSAKWPLKWGKDWWDENGPIFVHNWIAWRESSPWVIAERYGELAVEVQWQMVIGDAPVVGAIDRVMQAPNGDLIIVDLKTGAMTPPGYLQLGVYNVGLRHAWEISDDVHIYGSYWMARTNELTGPVDVTYMDKPFLDQHFWRADQIRKQGLFLPNVDKHCGWCGVKKFCPAFGGQLPDAVRENTLDVGTLDEESGDGEG